MSCRYFRGDLKPERPVERDFLRIPGRSDDTAGIAVAYSSISQDFSNAQVLPGSPSFSSETALEATSNFAIAPWWTVQPDFQYIWTPSAQSGSDNAAVFGIRTVITF